MQQSKFVFQNSNLLFYSEACIRTKGMIKYRDGEITHLHKNRTWVWLGQGNIIVIYIERERETHTHVYMV